MTLEEGPGQGAEPLGMAQNHVVLEEDPVDRLGREVPVDRLEALEGGLTEQVEPPGGNRLLPGEVVPVVLHPPRSVDAAVHVLGGHPGPEAHPPGMDDLGDGSEEVGRHRYDPIVEVDTAGRPPGFDPHPPLPREGVHERKDPVPGILEGPPDHGVHPSAFQVLHHSLDLRERG